MSFLWHAKSRKRKKLEKDAEQLERLRNLRKDYEHWLDNVADRSRVDVRIMRANREDVRKDEQRKPAKCQKWPSWLQVVVLPTEVSLELRRRNSKNERHRRSFHHHMATYHLMA